MQGSKLNVIDFGGGAGNHFMLAKIAFGDERTLNWHLLKRLRWWVRQLKLKMRI